MTATSPLEPPGPRGPAPIPVLLKDTHSPRREEDKDVAFPAITSCNELPAVFVLPWEGQSGVTQSHCEGLSRHSPACVHKHPLSEQTPASNSPTLLGSAQDPGHSPSAPH